MPFYSLFYYVAYVFKQINACLLYTSNCAEIMNFIMRTHPLHFTSSSTSFHEFIYFIELTHTAAVAEGVECDSWRRHIGTLLHKDSTLTVLNIQSRCYSTNNLPPLIIHQMCIRDRKLSVIQECLVKKLVKSGCFS